MDNSGRQAKEGETVNLWNELLAHTIKMEDKDAHILVLGNYDSAKKSLVTAVERLLGDKVHIESRNENSVIFSMKDKKSHGAFDYSYVSIRNPADESVELAKLNFWVLNEKTSDDVLQMILTEKRLKRFMVMVVLDFEKVGWIPDDLLKWFTFINQKVAPAFRTFELKDMDFFRGRLADIVMNYHEPVRTAEDKILNRKVDINPDSVDKLMLPEGVLQPNYGFPIIISMNKSDYILELRKEKHPDEILEMIEYTLRKNALPYAASVIYTSPKMGTNINVLADYLKHLYFQFPLPHGYNPAKDSLFIPIGYDNFEVMGTAFGPVTQKIFNEVVPKREEQDKQPEIEFKIKPNQKFLEELRSLQPVQLASQAPKNQAQTAADASSRMRFSREHRERIMNVLNRNPGASTRDITGVSTRDIPGASTRDIPGASTRDIPGASTRDISSMASTRDLSSQGQTTPTSQQTLPN